MREQRVGEGDALDRGQRGVVFGPLLEQVLDDQLVLISAGRADIDQAVDLVDLGHLVLEIPVEVAKALQEVAISRRSSRSNWSRNSL